MGLTLGLIGCGGISAAHIDAIKRLDGRLRVSFTVDPNRQAAETAAEKCGARPFDRLESAMAALDGGEVAADGLIIAAPPSVREPIVESAVRRGIGILLEKPLAHTLDAARRLAELTRTGERSVVHLAYCHRFTPAVVRMRHLIDEGRIGRPLRFENVFASWHPTMESAWMSDPPVSGGGVFIDTGSHSIDLFHFLLGPCEVEAAVLDHPWPGRGPATATTLVRGGDADAPVAGWIASGWHEPERFTVDVVGSAGRLHYDFGQPTALSFQGIDGTREVLEVGHHDRRFRDQLAAFADALEGGEPGALADLDDGLAVTRVIDAVERAATPSPVDAGN